MIGYLSNMQLAVGIDHLIYGAVFFTIIVFGMFYIGSFWQDPPEIYSKVEPITLTNDSTKNFIQVAFILLLSLSIWPVIYNQLNQRYQAQTTLPEWSAFTQNPAWQEVSSPNWEWKPDFSGVVNKSLRFFKKGSKIVGFYQASFGNENKYKKLISSANQLISPSQRKHWHYIEHSSITISNRAQKINGNYTLLRKKNRQQTIEAISWYQIGSHSTNNPYLAKLYQLIKRLTINTESEIYQVVYTSSESEIIVNKLASQFD